MSARSCFCQAARAAPPEEPGAAGAVHKCMEEQARPVLSPTQARQAARGQGVRYVLAISVALAVVAMLVAYFVA